MTKIRYIGNKPSKADNVAGTGVVWAGNGDVQEVPDASVTKLLAHSGIWEMADNSQAVPDAAEQSPIDGANAMSEADAKPPMANLDTMDKAALSTYAQRHFGHEFHHKVGEAKMRQTIIGLMNRG